VIASLVVALVTAVVFWWRSARHPSPVIEPALLRVRTFAWSNVVAIAFTVAFAAGLLANILWLQEVWHYSPLRTGLAIVPGPLMVPLFAAVAQRLSHRVPAGRLTSAGCALFAIGSVVILLSLGQQPAYLTEALPGWLLTGMGVGLTLPTILSTATRDLPATRAATGSAVVNVSRQIGTVLGISLLVAILGTTDTYAATHAAFTTARWVTAAAAVLAAVAAIGMSGRRIAVPSQESGSLEPVA
jgi:MFS family permease